jgi:peptidyl-prolyl cis-trans isomerase D
VGDRVLSLKDYQYALMMVDSGNLTPQQAKQFRLKETIMDLLIQRELLAAEAERMGFRVSDEEVEDFIGKSRMIGLGQEKSVPAFEQDGAFSYDNFRKFVQYRLGMSVRSFIDQQRRELLAERMRELIRSGVAVSPEEVKDEWFRASDQANVEYVRFPVHRYDAEVELAPEDIAAYAKQNEDKLKKLYEQRKAALYEKQPKQRKLRQILVKLPADADAEATAAASKKADELAGRLRKGEPFAKLARAVSDDPRSKGRGGELGWQRQGGTMLGPEVEAKVWAAKDGELVGPIKTGTGFVLVQSEGSREGDISYEAASAELAEAELRQERVTARAKTAAEAALAKGKAAPDKTLEDLFPAPAEEDKDAGKPQPPHAQETGLFARRGNNVATLGPAPELAKAIFALTSAEPFAGPVHELGSFIIVKLKERKQPDPAEFEKDKLGLAENAALRKGAAVVVDWAQRRCMEAKRASLVDVNLDLLRYEGGGAVSYEACTPVRF